MASAKIVFKDKPNADKTISVSLQIIHNRVSKYKLLARVPEKNWDPSKLEVRSKSPDFAKINQLLTRELAAAKDYLLDCALNKKPVEPEVYFGIQKVDNDLVSHLRAKASTYSEPRTSQKYNATADKITKAGLNRSIFSVNELWIHKYNDYLKSINNNPNTREKEMKVVGSVFTAAKKKGLISVNPFDDRVRMKSPGKKAKLNKEEFIRWKDTPIEDEDLLRIRNLWTFSVLARGMRAFDILTLQWSDVKDGRLIYQAQKKPSQGEGKWHNIKMTAGLIRCLDGLDRGAEYVFPFVKDPKSLYTRHPDYYKKHVAAVLSPINVKLKIIAGLCGINKSISFHCARHTFSYLNHKSGADLSTTQALLGHSDITITKGYIEDLMHYEDLDNAAEKTFE